jgi:sterol desaturase/sphingolipid hydroxylase (fatty acid hydroxylase superfamily)
MSTTATDAVSTGARRRSITLAEAAAEFWRWTSPRLVAVTLVVATVARVAVGDWRTADLLVVLALVAAQPFVEWTTHVFLLHLRPMEVGGRSFDPIFARKHRDHHADPRDTSLVFIPVRVLVGLLVGVVLVGVVVLPALGVGLGVGLTYVWTMAAIGMVYEWTHYLIHTDYRPRTRAYRALWRHHRLHHFKNEHYWFAISNPVADRVLGTAPDPSTVETSPTVHDLLGRERAEA